MGVYSNHLAFLYWRDLGFYNGKLYNIDRTYYGGELRWTYNKSVARDDNIQDNYVLGSISSRIVMWLYPRSKEPITLGVRTTSTQSCHSVDRKAFTPTVLISTVCFLPGRENRYEKKTKKNFIKISRQKTSLILDFSGRCWIQAAVLRKQSIGKRVITGMKSTIQSLLL